MVPFSFENIARSASLDAPSAFPVSDAARATHDSFESHLQRAVTTTVDQSTRRTAQEDEPRKQTESASNESLQNEPIRQDIGETRRDVADAREADAAEATTAPEVPAEDNDEEPDRDAASEIDVVTATTAGEVRATILEPELEASGDLDDNSDRVVANKPVDAPLGDEGSELDTSLVTHVQGTAGDEVITSADGASTAEEIKRVSGGESAEPADSETRARRLKPSDTNKEVADEEFHEAAPVTETTIWDDAPSRASITQQRRGNHGDISAYQSTSETPNSATGPVAVDVVETAGDTASEDSSRQRGHHQDMDGLQSIRNAAAAGAMTTTPGTPSRFSQHLLARTEDPSARGLTITSADQTRFVDRVARAVQSTGERGGTLRLRLSPPELGSLTLEVKVQGGGVSARVEADTPAARSLLLEHLPLLRERLAEYGMRVDQFDVDLTDRHAGGTPGGLQQNDQQHEDRPRTKATSLDPDDTAQAIPSEAQTRNGNEQLNIIV